MTRKAYFGGIAVIGATILVSAGLLAQEKGSYEMSAEEQAMMEAMNSYMTTGEPHQQLASRAGEWTFHAKLWYAPGLPPEESDGKAEITSVMDGRYIVEKFEGVFMDGPFKGFGIFGYDNLTQTYVGVWIDNFKTGIMRYDGAPSGDGKTIHWTSDQPDFEKGTYTKISSIDKILDDDEHIHTWYSTTPEGEEYKFMELHYKRK